MEESEGNELHRICFTCAKVKQSATSGSKAGTGKRKGPGTVFGELGSSKRANGKGKKMLCNRLNLYCCNTIIYMHKIYLRLKNKQLHMFTQ